MKKYFWQKIAVGLLIGAACSCFYLKRQTLPVNVSSGKQPSASTGVAERTEFIPASSGEIVRHSCYVLSFNCSQKQAEWVYYSSQLNHDGKGVQRTDNFREDKAVPCSSAKPSDYAGSGYDRGHLCPAADMTQSAEAMSETFLMSNISPQTPAFNRGIWKTLEKQVRKWGNNEKIYVVTGPVFKKIKGYIGKSRILVPGYFYKVIYSPSRQQMLGFVLPNEESRKSIMEHVVSVDSVESLTGIDFFPQLPDSLENSLEACPDYRKWQN